MDSSRLGSTLYCVVSWDLVQFAQFILDNGADINKTTPALFCHALEIAACFVNGRNVKLLLDAGADFNGF
jgi:hypothetical protein